MSNEAREAAIELALQAAADVHGGYMNPTKTRAVRAAIAAFEAAKPNSAPVQCCMCGKKGLSTVEGDGGQECQLADGRWTCSSDCYYRAVDGPVEAAKPAGEVVKWQARSKKGGFNGEWVDHGTIEPVWLKPDHWERRPLYAALAASPVPSEWNAALGYAQRLAAALSEKHYPDVPQWRPLPDLLGVLTQIDNMTAALTRPEPAQAAGVKL